MYIKSRTNFYRHWNTYSLTESSWQLNCFLCTDDEPSKHEHKTKIISIKGDSSKLDWQNLRGNVAQTQGKAKDWFDKYGALVDLLSKEEFQGNSQLKRDH